MNIGTCCDMTYLSGSRLFDLSGGDVVELGLIDSIFLFRHKIIKTTRVSKTLKVFHTASAKVPFVLKFSYPGNTQYHKLSTLEASGLIAELTKHELNSAEL